MTTITIQPDDQSAKYGIKLAPDATPQDLPRSQSHDSDLNIVFGFSLSHEATVEVDGGIYWASAPGASVDVSGEPGYVEPDDGADETDDGADGTDGTDSGDDSTDDSDPEPEPDPTSPAYQRDTPWPVPGTIQAEAFDSGGYSDDEGSQYDTEYRDAAVDIRAEDAVKSGYCVGYFDTGDWLEYTVDTDAGALRIVGHVATTSDDPRLQVHIDNDPVAETTIDPTGGWTTFAERELASVDIEPGTHTIRITSPSTGVDLDYLRFEDASDTGGDGTDGTDETGETDGSDGGDDTTDGGDETEDSGDKAQSGYGEGPYGGVPYGGVEASAGEHIAGNQQVCRYVVPDEQAPDATVAPADGAAGLQAAIDDADPGDLIYLEGGTYAMDDILTVRGDGESGNRIVLAGRPGERPVLDFSQLSAPDSSDPEFDFGAAVELEAAYWTLRNIEVKESPGFGIHARAGEQHLLFEHIESHHHALSGLAWIESSHNEVRHSEFHHNYDARNAGEHADGVAIKQGPGPEGKTANRNVVRCCDMHHNSDDGVDTYRSNDNELWFNRAWENGKIDDTTLAEQGNGNGFKFGPWHAGGHLVVGNLAWGNVRKETGEHAKATGFDYNGSEVGITLYHNTAWNNDMGFSFQSEGDTLVNNLAAGNAVASTVWSGEQQANVFGADASVFRSTDPADAAFLVPDADELVDAGVAVDELDWAADGAPDIGALETPAE